MKSLNTFKTFKREPSVEGGGDGSIPMDDLSGKFFFLVELDFTIRD